MVLSLPTFFSRLNLLLRFVSFMMRQQSDLVLIERKFSSALSLDV